jgi:hypothetical protein
MNDHAPRSEASVAARDAASGQPGEVVPSLVAQGIFAAVEPVVVSIPADLVLAYGIGDTVLWTASAEGPVHDALARHGGPGAGVNNDPTAER